MKLIISIGLSILISVTLVAQNVQVNDVKTPLNNTVNSWLMEEDSDPFRAALDDDYSISHPDAIQFDTYDGYSSTNMFNCHSYAWYMSQKHQNLQIQDGLGIIK